MFPANALKCYQCADESNPKFSLDQENTCKDNDEGVLKECSGKFCYYLKEDDNGSVHVKNAPDPYPYPYP